MLVLSIKNNLAIKDKLVSSNNNSDGRLVESKMSVSLQMLTADVAERKKNQKNNFCTKKNWPPLTSQLCALPSWSGTMARMLSKMAIFSCSPTSFVSKATGGT
jgi:hypothetical protein